VKRRIVLLGPPASGKGTQAEMIAAKFGIPSASPGAMFREEENAGTELGIAARKLTSQGKLVPDELVCQVVQSWLTHHDSEFVFDGFPRSRGQADALEGMLTRRGTPLDVALSLEADQQTITKRVQNRMVCSQCRTNLSIGLHVANADDRCPKCGGALMKRADDTMGTLELRMREYLEKSALLLSYYDKRGLLRMVDSTRAPDVVFASIVCILEAA
jgi:adenylate kinase